VTTVTDESSYLLACPHIYSVTIVTEYDVLIVSYRGDDLIM